MMELWQSLSVTYKMVLGLSSLAFAVGIVGFLWFMIGHSKRK
jgi:hypothetical protein